MLPHTAKRFFSRAVQTAPRINNYARPLSTNNRNSKPPTDPEHDLFHPDNVADLSPLEVARLRLTYGLLMEHVAAMKTGAHEVDPSNNPMIDPRSFDIRKLPVIPDEVLKQFRKDFPPEEAAQSRPVQTFGIWEPLRSNPTSTEVLDREKEHAQEWAAVDERTMDPIQFSKMQRQSFTKPSQSTAFRSTTPYWKPKTTCPLTDERGRVRVDFRAVGTLSTYLSEAAKILPKRKSGLRSKAQRKVARAVKTARTMALLHPEPKPKLTVEEMLEMERIELEKNPAMKAF